MLSVTASYAIRALSCLARSPAGEALLGRELAERAEVPANYLAKILLVLKHADLVEATRGTGGGYRLDRAPDEISLIEIVELFDSQGASPGCLLQSGRQCSESKPCAAHERWSVVRDSYVSFLSSTTLRDLCGPPGTAG